MENFNFIYQNYVKTLNTQSTQNNPEQFDILLKQVIELIDKLDQYYNPWLKEQYQGVKLLNIHQLDLNKPIDILKDFSQYFKNKIQQLSNLGYKLHRKWVNTQEIPFRRVELLQLSSFDYLKSYSYFKLSNVLSEYEKQISKINQNTDKIQNELTKKQLDKNELKDLEYKLQARNPINIENVLKYQRINIQELPTWFTQSETVKQYNEAANRTLNIKQIILKKQQAITDKFNEFIQNTQITPQIRKQYFVNFGYANGWSAETYKEFNIASALHSKDMKEHPELHEGHTYEPYRCCTEYKCKCGFGHGADSSD